MADKNFQGSSSLYFYNEKYYYKIDDSLTYSNTTDMTFLSATCGRDFIYSRCDFKQNGKFNIDFRDN